MAYETFFESYSRRDMTIDDSTKEKKILSAFLFNMGVLYILMGDFDFSFDFLNEAIDTLDPQDEAMDTYVAVSKRLASFSF